MIDDGLVLIRVVVPLVPSDADAAGVVEDLVDEAFIDRPGLERRPRFSCPV